MTEKRKHPRYACKIKTSFDYYEGKPDDIDLDISVPKKGSGYILDISCGGLFIISNERVTVGLPIKIAFKTKKNAYNLVGRIVRTGLLKKNPSEVARKFAQFSAKGDAYLAVEFETPLDNLNTNDL